MCFRYFVDEDPVWQEHSELIKTEKHFLPDNSVAQYTGGIVQVCTVGLFLSRMWTVESDKNLETFDDELYGIQN